MAILTTAATLVEDDALKTSDAVFVYDAPALLFGKSLVDSKDAKVHSMQTRDGAGNALAGFLKGSKSTKPVSVLASPRTLVHLAQSLVLLPGAAAGKRQPLAIHVSSLGLSLGESEDDTPALVPDLPSVFHALDLLTVAGITVIVSSTPAEIASSIETVHGLNASGKDVVHVFDGVHAAREERSLSAFGKAPSATERPFVYSGPASPKSLVVLPASLHSSLAISAVEASPSAASVGVLTVRLLRPWSSEALLKAINSASGAFPVEKIYVYSESNEEFGAGGVLYDDVLTSVLTAPAPADKAAGKSKRASVLPLHVPEEKVWTVNDWARVLVAISKGSLKGSYALGQVAPNAPVSSLPELGTDLNTLLPPKSESKLAVFWDEDSSSTSSVAKSVATVFAEQASKGGATVTPRLLTEYDNFKGPGASLGLKVDTLLLEPASDANAPGADHPLPAVAATSAPNLLFISKPASVLPSYSPLAALKPNATSQVIFASEWTPEEFDEKLNPKDKEKLYQLFGKGDGSNPATAVGNVKTIDLTKLVNGLGLPGAGDADEVVGLAAQATFWTAYFSGGPSRGSTTASQQKTLIVSVLSSSAVGKRAPKDLLERLVDAVQSSITDVPIPAAWGFGTPAAPGEGDDAAATEASGTSTLPSYISANGVGPNVHKAFADPQPSAPEKNKSWNLAAKQFIFPEAYGADAGSRRPDLPETNFVLTVTENRRLTPLSYDRNVFHMELDTTGTGLKYAVGEALGVHGLNDETEVKEFIEWFGLDRDAVVQLPNREDAHGAAEYRTVFQILHQNLDIFGKPPKSFYEALSKVATSTEEKKHLRFIASAEGSSTFKKWSELDTVTYADVLKAFPSAKEGLGLAGLLREVALIKPRHYSIASSQNAVGNSVHLLIVTVDWVTPKGTPRFGQCTRYLAGLPVGAKVMVSVKPSVMKLPPLDTQPIIMAGLGTGAAPFRAFLQERAWQQEQGREIGPLVYYFGSRYRSQEYLYGEEIEAWMQDGILTKAGLAFSRDGPNKVYIQHKMKEDGAMLADYLDKGVFYLCGPTWPVPDVYEALIDSFVKNKGQSVDTAKAYIEELKEAERYVLEVY